MSTSVLTPPTHLRRPVATAPDHRPAPHKPTHQQARWLHVLSHLDPSYGGLSSAVPALAAALAASGTPASLAGFCHLGQQYHPPALTHQQVTFWPASRGPWLHSDLRASFRLHTTSFQGIHVHGLWEQSTSSAIAAARAASVPYVLSAHGMLEPWALNTRRLKKRIYTALVERGNVAGAACLHALTHAEAAQYVAFGARGPIAVIPNAVDIPAHVSAEPFLDAHPTLRGKRLLLFLARLHPKKGLDILLDAWANVSAAHPGWHLVLAGPDSEGTRAALEQRIAALQLAHSVTFTGMLPPAQRWSALAAAEAFTLPSYSEGLSMGVLEALGMGLPVLITTPCNMPQVTHAGAGFEVEPTTASLAPALQTLLANSPQQNAAIGQRGAALIREHYTWSRIAAQFAELYGLVLDRTLATAPTSFPVVLP